MADTVGDIMIKEVVTLRGNPTIYEVVKTTAEKKVGSIVFVDDENRPVGIVTEKDIVRKAVAKDLNLKKETADKIMTSPVYTVAPEVSTFYAAKIMQEKDFRRLPITQNGKLVGLVTESLLTKYFTQQRMEYYKKLNIVQPK